MFSKKRYGNCFVHCGKSFCSSFVRVNRTLIIQSHRIQEQKCRSFIGRQKFLFFQNGCEDFVEKQLFFASIFVIKFEVYDKKMANLISIIGSLQYQVKFSHCWQVFGIFNATCGEWLGQSVTIFSSIFRILVTTLLSSKMFFSSFFIFQMSFNFSFGCFLLVFWQQDAQVKGQSRIHTAESANQGFFEQLNNFGLCWERDNCLRKEQVNAATERAGRRTFSWIVRKSTRHFFCSILEYFAEYNGVLKIVDVVKLRQFFQTHGPPKFSHIFTVYLTYNFVHECAIKFDLAKKFTLGNDI